MPKLKLTKQAKAMCSQRERQQPVHLIEAPSAPCTQHDAAACDTVVKRKLCHLQLEGIVWMGLHVVAWLPLRHFRPCNGAAIVTLGIEQRMPGSSEWMDRYFPVYFRRESSYYTEGRGMEEMPILATACIQYIVPLQTVSDHKASSKDYSS